MQIKIIGKSYFFIAVFLMLFIFSNTFKSVGLTVNHLNKKFISTPTDSIASADSTDDSDVKYREYIIQDESGTNTVIKGRVNGKVPYSEPGFTYNALSGFTTGFTINRLLGKYHTWDELNLLTGWNFDFTDSWDGTISYSHQIYNKATPKLNSNLNNLISLESGYDFDILYTSLTGEDDFGKARTTSKKGKQRTSDYSVTWLISHDFEVDKIFYKKKKKDKLEFEPAISWVIGTQNYYDQYFKSKVADNTLNLTYNPTKSATAFSTLDYEFAVPLTYTVNRFAVKPEWDYYIPENIVSANTSSKPYAIGLLTLTYTFKSTK